MKMRKNHVRKLNIIEQKNYMSQKLNGILIKNINTEKR